MSETIAPPAKKGKEKIRNVLELRIFYSFHFTISKAKLDKAEINRRYFRKLKTSPKYEETKKKKLNPSQNIAKDCKKKPIKSRSKNEK